MSLDPEERAWWDLSYHVERAVQRWWGYVGGAAHDHRIKFMLLPVLVCVIAMSGFTQLEVRVCVRGACVSVRAWRVCRCACVRARVRACVRACVMPVRACVRGVRAVRACVHCVPACVCVSPRACDCWLYVFVRTGVPNSGRIMP